MAKTNKPEPTLRVQVEVDGANVKVRLANSENDTVRKWNVLMSPGSVDYDTGWRGRELRALGDGIHEIKKKQQKADSD